MDNDDESELENALQTIMNLFQRQKEKYSSIIQSQNEKISELEEENNLQNEENKKYKNQIKYLQSKLNSALNTLNGETENNFGYNTNFNKPKFKKSFLKDNSFLQRSNNFSQYDSGISKITYNPSYINTVNNFGEQSPDQILLNQSKYSNKMKSEGFKLQNNIQRNLQNNLRSNTEINLLNNLQAASVCSQSMLSNNTAQTCISKYDVIREKISKIRSNCKSTKAIKPYRSNKELFEDDNSSSYNMVNYVLKPNTNSSTTNTKNTTNNNSNKKTGTSKKTTKFLNECKQNLNSNSYEKLLKLLKQNENPNEDKEEINQNINELLEGYPKLKEMFENL
ncbi:MAG: hypothetical protein MJ252_01855 [archaeon]|nr:hypothetical protein [archaeon]